MATNDRCANGNLGRKNRARFKAMGSTCGICHGKYGPIHYDEPSDNKHPLSFVIDEIHPISRYAEFGYESKRAAAEDWNNLQAAHYFCNQMKSNKLCSDIDELIRTKGTPKRLNISDGDW